MNTTHIQPTGLPASFDAKFVMLTNICNASIATPRRIVYSAHSYPLDENTTFNVYEINKGLLCHDATIDTVLNTLQDCEFAVSEYQFNNDRMESIARD